MPRFNSKQKRRRRRRRRAGKRQQLLSVDTVKKIAKEVAQKLPEVKFKHFQVLDGSTGSNQIIQEPTDDNDNYVAHCLFDTTDISVGTAKDERIGNTVHLKGIKLNMSIRGPRKLNVDMTDTYGGMSTYLELHVRVIKFNAQGRDLVDLVPPKDAHQIAPTLFENNYDLALSTRELKWQNIYHKKIIMRPKVISALENNQVALDIQPAQPLTYFLDPYIKIDKRLQFTGTQDGEWKNNYFLWVYAYNVNHGKDGEYWGGSSDYCPRVVGYSWTNYFTDA